MNAPYQYLIQSARLSRTEKRRCSAVQIDFDELKLRVTVKGGGRTVESMWSIMGDALRRCGKTWFGFKNCC